MSNIENVSELLKSLTGQRNTLSVPRAFIQFMDSVEGGLFLNQLIFWSDKGHDVDGWFYKTYEEWEKEICLSTYKVKKYAEMCEEMGFLETKLKQVNRAPRVHYKFDFEKFTKRFFKFLGVDFEKFTKPMDFEKFTKPITDQYHKNTTYNNGAEKTPEQTSVRDEEGYNRLLASVVSACKFIDPAAMPPKEQKALDTLYESGVDPEEVDCHYGDREQGWWWRHFWKGRKHQHPTPRDILQTIGQARDFKERDVPDDRDPSALRAWRQVKKAAAKRDHELIEDKATLDLIRDMWPDLKKMTDAGEHRLRERFMKRFHEREMA